jgi:5,5'-dehydrodivanillate O-demethylase oxygenase subunit
MSVSVMEQSDSFATSGGPGRITFRDVATTGPGTLAGDYLRNFWQPVAHSEDVVAGRTRAIRALGEDFTLYRGASGKAYLVGARCPHRAMPMHAGWVEGEEIRCFYHGWKFDGEGQCTQQPAERPSFCHKVRMAAYPTQEYLGLVFAFLGTGTPPALPRYPAFEGDNVVLNHDSYVRACHFFNNLENGGDLAHIPFAHGDASGAWDELQDGATITTTESCWGATIHAVRRSGREIISQFGMPNVFHVRGVPDDPEVQYREFVAWWVPIDDDRHTQFTVARQPADSPVTPRYQARRAAKRARQDLDREAIARAILAGKMRIEDVDKERVNMVFLQDDVAQMGVGRVSERPPEHLGRSDSAVTVQRRLWVRELIRFAHGELLTAWRHDPAALPVKAEF